MKYLIYFSLDPNDCLTKLMNVPAKIDLKNYEKIALVETDTLDEVFTITNHLDWDWQTKEEVLEIYRKNARSSCVGDVALELDGDISTPAHLNEALRAGRFKAHMIMGAGWKEIPSAKF